MTPPRQPSRRDFLKTTSVAAGAALAGGLSVAGSAHAAGSDVIKVALIGAGGRGTGAVSQLMNADKNLKVIAVADYFADRAQGSLERLKKSCADQVDATEVLSGFDAYKQAIATDADLIVIATSPGFRPIHYAAAVDASKHVFMEKPCCTDAAGYRMLQETNKKADEKSLLVGVGLQRRHQPNYMETIARIRDGALGDVMFTRVYWNGGGVWTRTRANLAETLGREPTEMEYQMRNWYYFAWLSGDHICEQHIHNLDVGNWVMGDEHPVEANGMGGREVRTDANSIKQGLGPGAWGEIYDHHFIEYTYADGRKMFSQCRHIRGCWNNVSEAAHGTEGTSNCSGRIEGANAWRFDGKKVSGHQQEQTDLVAALRAGERYNEGYFGATASFTAVLGRMATYSGQIVRWDEAAEQGGALVPYDTELNNDTTPPVVPKEDGAYPVAVPGATKPY